MIVYAKIDGKETELDIPMFCEDITYDQFEDFQANERKYKKELNDDEPDDAQVQWHLRHAVNQIIKGDLSAFPFMILTDDPKRMLKNHTYQFSMLDPELSIHRLYIHLVNLMNSYENHVQPKQYVIEWYDIDEKGNEVPCKYYMDPTRSIDLLIGDTNTHTNPITSKRYTSGEVLEILEFQRSFSKKINATQDTDGNLSYNLGLSEMAILLRKDGYKLPRKRADFRAHIEKYKRIFAKLPLNVVFDCRFFLLSIFKHYGKFLSMNYSLKAKSHYSRGLQKSNKVKKNH